MIKKQDLELEALLGVKSAPAELRLPRDAGPEAADRFITSRRDRGMQKLAKAIEETVEEPTPDDSSVSPAGESFASLLEEAASDKVRASVAGPFIETPPSVVLSPEYVEIEAFLSRNESWSGFYRSLKGQLLTRGTLSPKQIAACEKGMAQEKGRAAVAAERKSFSGIIHLKPFIAKKFGVPSKQLNVTEIVKETAKAIQVKTQEFPEPIWLPKSQLV